MNAEEIFHEAVEISDPNERATYLDRVCGDNDKLRAQVEALLHADAEAGDFLESPAVEPDVTVDASPLIEGPGTRIGRYELLELIGEGGMGLVYLAEQKEPVKRRVALKIIKPGMDTKSVIARFEAERQALAVLDHPNIARVFDAGTTQAGRPYFVMEHVKGIPITTYCDKHKLDIEQRLKLFRQVCEGIHHAHQKGIIHRDIKPSNILVAVQDDKAVPKIIDFGIAKAATQPLTDKTFFTSQGQLLGTPQYMSPEQVDLATHDIDTRSDIYSLGVVLYELLAGVLPFEAERFERAALSQIQHTIREVEPASPSIRLTALGEGAKAIAASRGTQVIPLARRLHRELEWIPLKAMRKERVRRYRSASELADDIQNYLNGNPLIAGPETAIYRVKKFVRRHAGSVATVALVAAAIILGLVISAMMYYRSEKALQREAFARATAEQAEKTASERAEDLRQANYVNSIQSADSKYREGNIRQLRGLLESCPKDLRGWEWNRLNYISDQSIMTLRAHEGFLRAMVLSPDGRHIISAGQEGTIKVWDSVTGEELKTFRGHEGAVQALAVSSDGKRIVSGGLADTTIKVWDAETGEELRTIRGHNGGLSSVAFSMDGILIASASFVDRSVKVWDMTNGANVMTLPTGKDDIECVTFSPDGKYLASARGEGEVKIWELSTGIEAVTIEDAGAPVAFSPDSRCLVSGGDWDGSFEVWDVATGNPVTTFRGYQGPVSSIMFSPDGKQIAGDSGTNTVRIWDAETGEELRTFRGHEWIVGAVAFSPDGKRLISGSWDGTVKIWDLNVDREQLRLRGPQDIVRSIAFSPDGKCIASASHHGMVKLWDVRTGTEMTTLQRPGPWRRGLRHSVVFSPDGKHIAASSQGGLLRFWDAATRILEMTLGGRNGEVGPVAFSADGTRVAISTRSPAGEIRVLDPTNGKTITIFGGHKSRISAFAYGPDGKCIASGDNKGAIRVWESDTGTERARLPDTWSRNSITSIAFSPDGKRILFTNLGRGGRVLLWDWDPSKNELLHLLGGHTDVLTCSAFSPDGKRIISGSRDRTARVWDSTTATELLTLRAYVGVSAVAFSPDGKTVVVGGADGTVLIWESGAPGAGYEPRKTGAAATKLVDELQEKLGFYHDVINNLQNDVTLDISVRGLALQIANSRKWEDADKLRAEALEIVSSSSRNINEYRTASEKVEKANAWEPNDPAILSTLGAAQYRLSLYDEALATLTKATRILSDAGEECDPTTVAFMAMSLHRLSRTEQAKSTLEQLRELFEDDQLAYDILPQDFLAEAEKLIEGEEQ